MGKVLTDMQAMQERLEMIALYKRLGFTDAESELLTDSKVELVEVAHLLKRGCSCELAIKILL